MGIMLVRKLSKTNAAFQLSNLPAALKIERSIGRLQRRVAKVSPKWEEEKTQAKCLKWMSMRCGEQKTMATAMASTFIPPPSCSTKLNSWAKWLALLIRPAPAQRWGHESHGSAQANGQIVNVEPSAKLTCQTDYMSWPQPKATQTADGRTDWLTDWLVGSLWHRVAFRFHCQLTLLQLHSATLCSPGSGCIPAPGLAKWCNVARSRARSRLFYGLVAVAAAYCFRFASMWQCGSLAHG